MLIHLVEPPKNFEHNRTIPINEVFLRTRLASNDWFNEPAFVEDVVFGQGQRL